MKRLFVLVMFLPVPGFAQSAAELCVARDRLAPSVCDCIEAELGNALGEDGLALYTRVGLAYFTNMDGGMARGDAWDAAVRAEADAQGTGFADLLGRTNEMGQHHRAAMEGCK